MGDKIPPLKRRYGTTTSDKAEQAEELLSVFFPPLPAVVEVEERRPAQREIAMPELTLEEVEEKAMAAKAWKAPGEDGLPAMVWKQLWPVVGDCIASVSNIPERRRAAGPVEERENHPAQEAGQGRLQGN
jgi:hypothetical protein